MSKPLSSSMFREEKAEKSGEANKAESGTSTVQTPVASKRSLKPAPLSSDEEAIIERAETDYTLKISLLMALEGKAMRAVRVYTSISHCDDFQTTTDKMMEAKNAFPMCQVYLIVGLCSDETMRTNNVFPMMSQPFRLAMVRHSRYVNEVIIDAPWEIQSDFIEDFKIDFIYKHPIILCVVASNLTNVDAEDVFGSQESFYSACDVLPIDEQQIQVSFKDDTRRISFFDIFSLHSLKAAIKDSFAELTLPSAFQVQCVLSDASRVNLTEENVLRYLGQEARDNIVKLEVHCDGAEDDDEEGTGEKEKKGKGCFNISKNKTRVVMKIRCLGQIAKRIFKRFSRGFGRKN